PARASVGPRLAGVHHPRGPRDAAAESHDETREDLDPERLLPAVDVPPWLGQSAQHVIQHLDVLDAALLEPALERRRALLRVHRNAVLPGRAATEHAVEARAGLGRVLQALAEPLVVDSS